MEDTRTTRKRACRICGKSLSDYNKEDVCFHHQQSDIVLFRFSTTKCTSRSTSKFNNAMMDYYGDIFHG